MCHSNQNLKTQEAQLEMQKQSIENSVNWAPEMQLVCSKGGGTGQRVGLNLKSEPGRGKENEKNGIRCDTGEKKVGKVGGVGGACRGESEGGGGGWGGGGGGEGGEGGGEGGGYAGGVQAIRMGKKEVETRDNEATSGRKRKGVGEERGCVDEMIGVVTNVKLKSKSALLGSNLFATPTKEPEAQAYASAVEPLDAKVEATSIVDEQAEAYIKEKRQQTQQQQRQLLLAGQRAVPAFYSC